MKRSARTALSVLLAIGTFAALTTMRVHGQSGDKPLELPKKNPTHRFQEIAEDVYFVVGTGSIFVQSNCMVVINEDDVIVVDSHVTPEAARALLKAIRELTKKPVRYLINSHYHFDHAHGNQVFPDDIEIIGHEYTRAKLLGNVLQEATYQSFSGAIPGQIEAMKRNAAEESNAARRERLEGRIRVQEAHLAALEEVVPTPPNLTLDRKLSLFRGDREIQLIFLGRGHTGGDVVTYLPKEKIVFTGDLMLPFLAYMGDGYVDEWPDTLEALKRLDFQTVLPGHGPPFQGHERITNFQAYLRDLWKRTSDLKKQGLSAQETAEQIDLTHHSKNFPQIQQPGADPRAIARIYVRLNQHEPQ